MYKNNEVITKQNETSPPSPKCHTLKVKDSFRYSSHPNVRKRFGRQQQQKKTSTELCLSLYLSVCTSYFRSTICCYYQIQKTKHPFVKGKDKNILIITGEAVQSHEGHSSALHNHKTHANYHINSSPLSWSLEHHHR